MSEPALASDGQASPSSRIIAAEELSGVSRFDLGELAQPQPQSSRKLTSRDFSNDTARAAYVMGRRRGWEQGWRAGLAEGQGNSTQAQARLREQQGAAAAGEFARIIEHFRSDMHALESQVASDLVSLAIDLAREVLRREPQCAAAQILPAAQEALRALGEGASRLELQLSAADAQALAPQIEQLGLPDVVLHQDPLLAPGACRVVADTGVADASFEHRWQAVMATLGRDEEPLP